jgi:hypothetical protein
MAMKGAREHIRRLQRFSSAEVIRVAGAALQGTLDRWREDFSYPIAPAAQNTALTVVCPATPNVIWRVTANHYVAP